MYNHGNSSSTRTRPSLPIIRFCRYSVFARRAAEQTLDVSPSSCERDPPATVNNVNSNRRMRPHKLFNFMGNPRDDDSELKCEEVLASGGSGSGAKKRSPDGQASDPDQKKAKYFYKDADLKFIMPDMNLSLATGGCSGLDSEDSDSDLVCEDGECMCVYGGGGKARAYESEPNCDLKL